MVPNAALYNFTYNIEAYNMQSENNIRTCSLLSKLLIHLV